MSRKVIRSEKLRKRKRHIFFIKMSAVVFLCVASIGGLVYAFNTDMATIQRVRVIGAQEFVNRDVEKRVVSILAGSYFGLIPKENILLYPKREILQEISNTFPRLQDIQIELDPFKEQTLILSLIERRESGVWCREVELTEDCYFIDKEGYVFAPAPTYSDGVMFSYRGYIEGDPLGKQFLNTETVSKIQSFIRAIENSPQIKISPIGLEYLGPNEYKLQISNGSYILFSDSYGLSRAYDNLLISIKQGDIILEDLSYVDIRIPNKVFYRHIYDDVVSE